MASILDTCTSGARPASPSLGDTLFETDTNRIITYDGTVWRVYDSDGIAYSTVGTNELHYPTGLWSSASATYYLSTSPDIHYDATILDGADAANNPADGAAVSTWGDRSGNTTDYDATQSSASYQPTFKDASSGPGSQPALSWATDKFDLTNAWSVTGSCTAIFVSQSLAAGSFYLLKASSYTKAFWEYFGQDYFFGGGSGAVSDTSVFNMHTLHRDGTSAEVFESGGTSIYGPASRTNDMEIETIGQGQFGYQNGTVSEILIFSSALSTSDLNTIRLYITNKYGITTTAFS